MAYSVPPKGERRQGTGALPKYARGMAPTKPKQGPPAPKPAAKAGEAARGGTARAGASSRAGEAARGGRGTSSSAVTSRAASLKPTGRAGEAARGGSANSNTSKAYSTYRQNALDYMAKVPGGTAKYAGELQRLQKEGSYDKRYGQSANQRAAGAAAARKVAAAKNPAEKKAANRSRGESL